MKRHLLILLSLMMTTYVSTAEERPTVLPQFANETLDQWHGFTRHNFTVDGCAAWIVEPKQALPGKPWSWCMEFPDAFTERCAAPQLLAEGFYHVHITVGNTFGSPEALRSSMSSETRTTPCRWLRTRPSSRNATRKWAAKSR